MIGAEIIFNEKETVIIGTYNFAYIFVSCGSKTGDWMVAAGSSFKERYTWMDRPLQISEFAGMPLAVGGDPEARHGIVLTANYIAKRKGVKTGMALWLSLIHILLIS